MKNTMLSFLGEYSSKIAARIINVNTDPAIADIRASPGVNGRRPAGIFRSVNTRQLCTKIVCQQGNKGTIFRFRAFTETGLKAEQRIGESAVNCGTGAGNSSAASAGPLRENRSTTAKPVASAVPQRPNSGFSA